MTAQTLSDLMDFDHVIRVHDDGTITEPKGIYAPELDGEEFVGGYDDWELLRGFTGQYSYSGPVMHPSEFIGGGLERHIRETPGYYVALVVAEINDETDESDAYGWAVAYVEVGEDEEGDE